MSIIRPSVCVSTLLIALFAGTSRATAGSPDSADAGASAARGGTTCDRSGPDVIVGDLPDVRNYNPVGGIDAFSVATTSCNVGDTNLSWVAGTNQHPVIAQNMYRLKDSRFEQIGQSWVKHGFFAVSLNECGCGCSGVPAGNALGVGCSDPYSAPLNGDQTGLGPRFEVNPTTGAFVYPHTAIDQSGNSIYKRLQVKLSDLDPALDGGGQYFVEGQYVTPDDAAAENQANNASYRPATVFGSVSNWIVEVTGVTVREQHAIRAWEAWETGVATVEVDIPGDGRVIVAGKVSDLGGGTFRYEYAVQNAYSDRAVGSLSVPIGPGAAVTSIGFHDVDYHSGEPFGGADWPGSYDGDTITWATTDYNANSNGNAIRWGTLYNFRFDVDRAGEPSTLILGMFKPGTPATMAVAIVGPQVSSPCPTTAGDGDGDCDADLQDFALLQVCYAGDGAAYGPGCACFDADADGDVDDADFALLQAEWSVPGVPAAGCTIP